MKEGIVKWVKREAVLVLECLAGLCAACFLLRGERVEVQFPKGGPHIQGKGLALVAGLFILCLLAVFRILNVYLLLGAVVVCLAVGDREVFRQVDYGLLLTFVCFFIFAGNMGEIPVVSRFLAGAMERALLMVSVGLSQVISNVPTALLLAVAFLLEQ